MCWRNVVREMWHEFLSEFFFCLRITSSDSHFKLIQGNQTEGVRTQLFDRASERSLARFPQCATAQTHLHRTLLSFAHKGHHMDFLSERKDVRRCCATNCTSCCASRCICARGSVGRWWSMWLYCLNSTLHRLRAQPRSKCRWHKFYCLSRKLLQLQFSNRSNGVEQ